ncbi:MAG: hypothetical protein DHS20C21_02870 [Gemmatimonadota bacterium]|nr:MAG: hypothetical protein DHS20C21_02870 [Gemmatimonadota bacterium]
MNRSEGYRPRSAATILPWPKSEDMGKSTLDLLDHDQLERYPTVSVPSVDAFGFLFALDESDCPAKWRISRKDLAILVEMSGEELQLRAVEWREHRAWPRPPVDINPFDLCGFLNALKSFAASHPPGTGFLLCLDEL